MATETLRPTGELSDIGLVSNDHTDHDHDPDSDTTTVDPTANNVNTQWGGDFATPTGDPTTGTDKQEFRVGVIKFQTGQAGEPNARIELWENGSLVRAGSNTGVSGTHSVLSFLWDASELATADGSLVQCKLIGTKVGGAGGTRAAVGIGGMEWNVEFTAGATAILADDIESASELTSPVLAGEHVLLADDIESASELTSPVLGGEHVLLADDIESASELTSPVVAEVSEVVLLADDIESASELTSPALAGEHVLLANDIESASELTSPALAGEHVLAADDIESASELTSPVLGGEHVLLADDIESASELSSPSTTPTYVFNANDIESASELSSPALIPVGQLRQLSNAAVVTRQRYANVGLARRLQRPGF